MSRNYRHFRGLDRVSFRRQNLVDPHAGAIILPPPFMGGWIPTQSSVQGTLVPNWGRLHDGTTTTGCATQDLTDSWIAADLLGAQVVGNVHIGGGTLSGVTDVAATLNASILQSSPDNTTWTDRVTITGVTNAGITVFTLSPTVTARYWRLFRTAGRVAICEWRFNQP